MPANSFGTPVAAPALPAAATEEPTATGRRTVVIAVAAGVAALGVLGGAAALVLGGGSDVELAAVPPAAVQPVPSVEPSPASTVSAPLPTAAVLGRNVFVPLVDDVGADAAGGDAPATDAPTGPPGGTAAGAATGGGSTTTGPAGPQAAAAEQRVRELQAQIATLTQQLVLAGAGDSALSQQVATLTAEQDALLAENAGLRDVVDRTRAELAKLRTVEFVSVDPVLPGDPLQLSVNGAAVTLDLEPAPDGGLDAVGDSVVLGTTTTGEPVVLTYRSVDDSVQPSTVMVQVGSSTYRVSVGGVLMFTVV
ncbi:hypothetical protein [Aquipuribacter hungaricus]|uniref:Uncharacterized protein n=1 Tax=Aquipuribacter hungaricus TaxID=545624 RepID=A0ABV7WFN3_9MICO